MTSRQHSPLVIVEGHGSRVLQPLPLRSNGGSSGYDEAWIRDLIFANPLSVPVHEIDPAFGPLIPVCKELDTRVAGLADAFFINSLGMPTLVECKLWRNPEARREVVGQILDYARALRRWTYSDLQRETARARREQGFNLAEFVKGQTGGVNFDESAFCDNVSRNLARSRILLLIIGDGIREGVEAIADYVQGSPGLHFTLGLVEAQVFEIGPDLRLVQPRVLARTVIFNRMVVDFSGPPPELQDNNVEHEEHSPDIVREPSERDRYMLGFWSELLSALKLDDVEQPMPKPYAGSNLFFTMPLRGQMWLTCYFWQREKQIGVFLGSRRTSELALEVGRRLFSEKEQINADFERAGLEVRWETESGKVKIAISKEYSPLLDPAHRYDQLSWFRNVINVFVNVLRPRISRMREEASNSEPLS